MSSSAPQFRYNPDGTPIDPNAWGAIAPFSAGYGSTGGTPGYGGGGSFNPMDVFSLSGSGRGGGYNPNEPFKFGMNQGTINAGLAGFQALTDAGGVYMGLKQLGLAKDAFKFQKQAYNTNLANQTAAYNTQMRDRVAGRHYNTEEERKAAEAAALLPSR